MDLNDSEGADVGQSIADSARSMVGDGGYGLYRYSNGIPAGTPKDNAFVNTVLANTGNDFGGKPPSLSDWANPDAKIPGFAQVAGPPRAGDVLATPDPVRMDGYSPNGQSLGIATGNGTSIGIHAGQQIAENTFGHEDGHDPVIRRALTAMGDSIGNLKKSFCQPDDGSTFGGAGETGAAGLGSELAGWVTRTALPNMGVPGKIASVVAGSTLGQGAYRALKEAICAPDVSGSSLTFTLPPPSNVK